MPPVDTQPQSVVRYLTRLLTAVVIHNGGELRIPLKAIREVAEESSRQMLVEDTNVESDELVLRFGSKHSAVYPVEPECLSPKPISPSNQTSAPISNPSSPQVRPPLTDEQERALEMLARYRRIKARIKKQPPEGSVLGRNELSEILG